MARTILVCGGRIYANLARLYAVLDAGHAREPVAVLIHGAAPGADQLAGQWASDRGITTKVFHADWTLHDKAAGPIRNAHMLRLGKPDIVIAFPGGRGTADMIRQATDAGVKVHLVK